MTQPGPILSIFTNRIVQALTIVALLSTLALEVTTIWKGSSDATVSQMQARYADIKQKAEAEETAYKAEIEKATATYAQIQQEAEANLAVAKAKIAQAKAPYQDRLAKARAELADAQARLEAYKAEIASLTIRYAPPR